MPALTLIRKFTVIMAVMIMPFIALAAPQGGGNHPAPDLSGLSKTLGVSKSMLETCMPKPEAGQRPARPNSKTIAGCLNDGGASVASADVDAALKEFGPKRR